MECNACGTRFRSMIAEAKHRHNFPLLCKRNKRFADWQQSMQKPASYETALRAKGIKPIPSYTNLRSSKVGDQVIDATKTKS